MRCAYQAKMQRLIIVSEQVDPDSTSTGYYWNAIIREFVKYFADVHVVCPKVSTGVFRDVYGIKLHPASMSKLPGSVLRTRLIAQCITTFCFVLTLMRYARAGDVVMCGTNPALLPFLVSFLKGVVRFRWILLVHDIFPENLVPASVLKAESLSFQAARSLSRVALREADALIAIGRDMVDVLRQKLGRDKRIEYVPNWASSVDGQLLQKRQCSLIKELHWEERVVFLFFGNFGRVQGIPDLLAGIRAVKDERAAFLLVGSGYYSGCVADFAQEIGMERVYYHPQIPVSERAQMLCACDIAIVSLQKGMYGLGVPSKAYFSLAADRPILAFTDSRSETARLVEETKTGWHCPAGEPALLGRVIDELCATLVDYPTRHCLDVAKEFYSPDRALGRLRLAVECLFEPLERSVV